MSQTELLEKLVARVAELEKDNDHQRERRNAARDCIKKMQKEQDALILRKQAEAVESQAKEWNPEEQTYSGRKPHKELVAEAQRLRQQADELEAEKAGGEQCR